MKTGSLLRGLAAVTSFGVQSVLAQNPNYGVKGYYTEPNTGINFWATTFPNGTATGWGSTNSLGGYTFGLALPENAATVNSADYLGLLVGSTPSGAGWSGIVHGTGEMNGGLMLVAWADKGEIKTSFRYSQGWQEPLIYTGDASLTPLYSNVNATNWTLVYHCKNCWNFNQPGGPSNNVSTSAGSFPQGWAQAVTGVTTPSDPNSGLQVHDNGMGVYQILVPSATQASYSKWASMTATHTTSATAGPTTTVAPPVVTGIPVPTGTTYDYVVIGGGAGGIPIADKLSEAGFSVLLVEKGPPSSGRWGGVNDPSIDQAPWLKGTNLTWIDVPGLCNKFWQGTKGVYCLDMDQRAGCTLGGGTAVNAGLWWKPNPSDWDVNFPSKWKAADMVAATNRVFTRIPGTDHPSLDGQIYVRSGYDVLAPGLAAAGWKNVTANNVPEQKNRTFAHTPYMYSHAERGGPMATYLVSATARPKFKLWMKTSVKKIVRKGGHASAIELEAFLDGGYTGTVNLTPVTGRVIVSAGAFGTAKLLMRSGIGPADQLAVVKASTDGPTMINSSEWITLPVGYNLDDHLNTDMIIGHPNISYYHWETTFDTPNVTDADNYLKKRTGPFAQAAPNIGPMFWEEITGPDKVVRQLQYTARVEGDARGNCGVEGCYMTLSQYLGRGQLSRGRATIKSDLSMTVSTNPWTSNPNDITAVITGIENMVKALSAVKNLTIIEPPAGTKVADWVNAKTYDPGARRANHWLGTAKIGTDDGRNGGTAVVDLNTKVYGTDNIFVVDASIFPGMPSTNPSALIVVASEKAASLILALPKLTANAKYAQCGGKTFSGTFACVSGTTCSYQNDFYSQCL